MKSRLNYFLCLVLIGALSTVSAHSADKLHAGSIVVVSSEKSKIPQQVATYFSNKYFAKTAVEEVDHNQLKNLPEYLESLDGTPALIIIIEHDESIQDVTSTPGKQPGVMFVKAPMQMIDKPDMTRINRSITRALSTFVGNKECPNVLCANAQPELHQEVGKHYIDLCPPCNQIVEKWLINHGMIYREAGMPDEQNKAKNLSP
jgi:hypothetical protein